MLLLPSLLVWWIHRPCNGKVSSCRGGAIPGRKEAATMLAPADRTAVSIGTSSPGELVHNFPLTTTGSPRMAVSQPVPIHNRKFWQSVWQSADNLGTRRGKVQSCVSASILEPEQSFLWYRPCCHLHKWYWAPKRKMYSSEVQVWCLQAGTPEKATLWGPWTKTLWWL